MPTATTPRVNKPRAPRLVLTQPQEFDPLEKVHQERVMALARAYAGEIPYLGALFHVPNGGWRHGAEAAAFQRQGVKPGVSDLLLPVPLGGWAGLAVELKRFKDGQPTEEQKAWLKLLAACGWKAVLCRGWRAAWREIWPYVHLSPTHELLHLGGSPTVRKDTDK